MKTFTTKEALKRGWELFKSHRNLLLFSTLIIMGLSGLQSVRTHDSHTFSSFGFFFGLLMFVVVNMLHIGWMKMLLKISDGEATSLSEMVKHANLFLNFIIVVIICGLIIGIGTVLLVIPGIYFAMKYMFAPVIAIDMHLGIKDTLKESARITKDVKLKLFAFSIVMLGVNILGAVVLLVGLLVSIPVTMLAYIYVYRKLSDTPIHTQTSATTTETTVASA